MTNALPHMFVGWSDACFWSLLSEFCTVEGITARLFCAAWWKTFLLWQCYPKKKHRYFLFLIFSRATDKNDDVKQKGGWVWRLWLVGRSSLILLSPLWLRGWSLKGQKVQLCLSILITISSLCLSLPVFLPLCHCHPFLKTSPRAHCRLLIELKLLI